MGDYGRCLDVVERGRADDGEVDQEYVSLGVGQKAVASPNPPVLQYPRDPPS